MYFVITSRRASTILAACALFSVPLSAQQNLPTQKVTAAHEAAPVPS
ncbi:MAG: hypothetical protein JF589_07530, partial [Gemmatimonadetes bacterium]|nr:hypothetical protein [Gemmatimonadota bacterium]